MSAAALSGKLSSELGAFSEEINSLRLRVEGEIDFNDEDEVFLMKSLKILLLVLFQILSPLCLNATISLTKVFQEGCFYWSGQ